MGHCGGGIPFVRYGESYFFREQILMRPPCLKRRGLAGRGDDRVIKAERRLKDL
jgi:hypothetical protein